MTAREPSDAEVDAAFNDIVARLTGREERGDTWADQHPLFADPDGPLADPDGPLADPDGPSADPDQPSAERDGDDRSRSDSSTDNHCDHESTGRDQPDDPVGGPVLRGEVLDPPPATGPDHGSDRSDEETVGWRVHSPPDDDELDELDLDELPRTPLPPWRPSSPALAAMLLIAGSTVVTVLLIAQVRLPGWAGWAALVAFLTGMGLLFSRLPRDRDEDSDDGAVV